MSFVSLSGFKKLVTALISPTAIPGALMVCVGIAPGLLPEEFRKDLPKMTELWSKVFGIPMSETLFFPFVGSCKLFGVASMWGFFGATADIVSSFLYAVLCGFATYQHSALGESIAPPLVIASLCIIRLGLALAEKKLKKA